MGLRLSFITVFSVMTLLLLPDLLCAQPKSVGATFSFTGIGICYEHSLAKENSFVQVNLRAETPEVFIGRQNMPGCSASFTWNIILKELLSPDGNTIKVFAGPGAAIGWGHDFKERDGLFFGLKGSLGVECDFSRNVTLSASIAPVVGPHIVFHYDHLTMRYYRNGIQYALVPEIGIKYKF